MKALNYLLYIKDSIPKGHTYDTELDEAIEELQQANEYTRVEVISFDGRVFCDRCEHDSYYEVSVQDDGKTLKLFKKKLRNKYGHC